MKYKMKVEKAFNEALERGGLVCTFDDGEPIEFGFIMFMCGWFNKSESSQETLAEFVESLHSQGLRCERISGKALTEADAGFAQGVFLMSYQMAAALKPKK